MAFWSRTRSWFLARRRPPRDSRRSAYQLNGILEQNEKLELGEKWTPEKLSELDIAKSIYLPALEILKQMDGIGQYNHNDLRLNAIAL
jgi:hypothetical protein